MSDRDPRLASEVYITLCRLWNIRPNISTARRAQTDGQSESAVEAITQLLRAFVNYNATDWDLLLPSICFAYNDSVSPSTTFSPLFLAHGEHPASPVSWLAQDLSTEISEGIRQHTAAEFVKRVADNVAMAQMFLEKKRLYYEKVMRTTVRFGKFTKGDLVLLDWRGAGVAGGSLGKLRPQWLGPFKVIDRRHENAYTLDLPPSMRISPTVGIRYLKPFYESHRSDPVADQLLAKIVAITDFRITPDFDGFYRAAFKVQSEPLSFAFEQWITMAQCVEAGAFDLLSEFLAALPDLTHKGNHSIGREVLDWQFRLRPFRGLVASFDPADPKKQFEILYEDGDSTWIDRAHLVKIWVKSLPVKVTALQPSPELQHSMRAVYGQSGMKRVLVLFSGTDSVGRFLRKHLPSGSQVLNLDVDPSAPNAVALNVMDWDYTQYPEGFFDMIWASPPCTQYSVAKVSGVRNLALADELVVRTLARSHTPPAARFVDN